MTKILIVDDEVAQSRGLSRAILLRRPDYTVLTSASGSDAIALLEEQDVDLVITDLQMTDMDGFELLAWVLSHRPSILGFAMTAYGNETTQARLQELGSIECFNKPLDIDALLARLSEGLAQSIDGHVRNVGLASFLQLIELEQKTCTLEVRCDNQVGRLFLRKGELLDALTGDLGGEAAAAAIIGWVNASIRIEGSCRVTERTIARPIYHIVMEAMRLRDESNALFRPRREGGLRDREDSVPCPSDFFGFMRSERPSTGNGSLRGRSSSGLHMPVGGLALAVVETSSGVVLASELRSELSLAELAEAALALLRQEQATLVSAVNHEAIEEVVLMTACHCEVIRPLPNADGFILLVFDPAETNLVMARLELDLFAVAYAAS